MAGANKLILVLAASSGALCNGQFMKPMVIKSFSSSWMSSSSWVPGRDGQMHQQVHEVRSETFSDHGMPVKHTESQTACRDGRCKQTVSIEKPDSIMVMSQQGVAAGSRWGAPMRFPPCLRAMLRGLSFPTVYVEEREVPATQVHFLAPRPVVVVDKEIPEGAAATMRGVPELPGPLLAVPLAALAGAAISLLALLIATALKCQRSSAREPPLQALGQPLAPAQEAAAASRRARRVPAAAPAAPKAEGAPEAVVEAAPAAVPVAAYLARVYAQGAAAAEAAVTRAYLGRVYARATA